MDGKMKFIINLLYISIVLSVWNIGVSNAKKLCYEKINGAINEKEYEPSTHICCNGQILPNNGIKKGCCAGKVYDEQLEICCGTTTHRRTTSDGYNIGCCGNKTYVQNGSSFCCGDRNLYKSRGEIERCCGHLRRDFNRETCCFDEEDNSELHINKKDHTCCGTKYFNITSHQCARENHVVPKNKKLCGSKQYDARLHSCCQGNIIMEPMGRNDNCCGTRKYNSLNENCCYAGHVISSDKVCCGSGFATRSQRCCQNNVLNITSPNQKCCGHLLFDPTKGQGCCQKGVYDTNEMKCCNGRIIEKNASCCGNNAHNADTTVCCNNEYVVAKQKPDHNKCCVTGNMVGQSYNGERESCIRRNGLAFVESGTKFCGDKPYTPDRDLCCASTLYSNAVQYGMRCCVPGYKAFNPSIQLCCNSRIFSKKEINSCNDEFVTGNDNGDDDDNNKIGDDDDDNWDEDDNMDTENDVYPDTEYRGICSICSTSATEAVRKIKQGDIDVCHNNANKFMVKKEKPRAQYQFIGMNMVNIYGYKKVRHAQRVHIPCTCRIDLKKVIIITDKPTRKSKLLLDEKDIVLPYSKEVRRQIRKIHKAKCRNKTDVKELLNDLKVYLLQIQLKVIKLQNKVMKKN